MKNSRKESKKFLKTLKNFINYQGKSSLSDPSLISQILLELRTVYSKVRDSEIEFARKSMYSIKPKNEKMKGGVKC